MAQSEVPEVWLWTTPPSQHRRGTGWHRQKQRGKQRESLRLIKTYTLSAHCGEFTQKPYVSLNFHSLLTLFKSLSREDVQSKASSWGRGAERSRVEPREEGEGGRVAVSSWSAPSICVSAGCPNQRHPGPSVAPRANRLGLSLKLGNSAVGDTTPAAPED